VLNIPRNQVLFLRGGVCFRTDLEANPAAAQKWHLVSPQLKAREMLRRDTARSHLLDRNRFNCC
jgi:hypothetical protein